MKIFASFVCAAALLLCGLSAQAFRYPGTMCTRYAGGTPSYAQAPYVYAPTQTYVNCPMINNTDNFIPFVRTYSDTGAVVSCTYCSTLNDGQTTSCFSQSTPASVGQHDLWFSSIPAPQSGGGQQYIQCRMDPGTYITNYVRG